MSSPGKANKQAKKQVAVIGGGCSGLACAWHLIKNTDNAYEVKVFEKSERLGGHAFTMDVPVEGGVPVDIGFMVFNDANYPNMTSWFDALGVECESSDMSLSVSLDGGKTVEWSSSNLSSLFANKWQLFKPGFYSFLMEMVRFNKEAAQILTLPKNDPTRVVTMAQYLRQNGYSDAFCSHYLLPMMAALWSASIDDVLQFPAEQLIGFLCNHRMLQIFERPEWKTVKGRSQSYTTKIAELLGKNARVNCEISKIKRGEDKYILLDSNMESVGVFDDIVFACHPPTVADMLADLPFDEISAIIENLKDVTYADNIIYVHSDTKLMPSRKAAWSSWNCMGKSSLLSTNALKCSTNEAMEGGESGFGSKISSSDDKTLGGENGRMKAVYVSYWLNKLQNLQTDNDIFVSLNPHTKPDDSLVYKKVVMAHPQFTPRTLKARELLLGKYQGNIGLWFCGAWSGYGFHEDGCRSGFEVATKLSSVRLPWVQDPGCLVLPPPDLALKTIQKYSGSVLSKFTKLINYTLPVTICKYMIVSFMKKSILKGSLKLILNDGTEYSFGDGSACGCDDQPVSLRIFNDWFFVKTALEYDLGLARSYMAGHFVVEPLEDPSLYDPVIRDPKQTRDETNVVLGDPVGLTRLFLLFIGNRDSVDLSPKKSAQSHRISNALSNASGLMISYIGNFLNYLRYKLTMDNSERGGSLKNIHAHYDLSNDLFTTFLDKETLMYSSAIYDAVSAPSGHSGMVFRGTLEEAQWRKLDTLLSRAQVKQSQRLLDIGFGWGGLSLHAAKKYGCKVHGITLSVEQKALADSRVKKEGLDHLITFEVIDYRTFAKRKENQGSFDRILSCEMIEAVGHKHLGEFFWAIEQLLAPQGVLVMEAITTPEIRYENYLRTTDFINTIIFPGSCCPSLHALVDASYKNSSLTLEHIDNIGLHYARTLAEWRRRFNFSEAVVRKLGFDDVFMRVWNYYLTYCEAGFHSQTENCLILVFSRPGCNSLVPLCETRSVTQPPALTDQEISSFLKTS